MMVRPDFSSNSWLMFFKDLGYPLRPIELDLDTLVEINVISTSYKDSILSIKRFYEDDYLEYCIIEHNNLTRSECISLTRRWKEKRLVRPFLIFLNSKKNEALLVIVPGRGTDTQEVRTLFIQDTLYHTDKSVLQSLTYVASKEDLRDRYDKEFLPYEKVREEFFINYKELYEKIVDKCKSYNGKYKFDASSYAQRFLGRLMFLYFLQKKVWLNNDKRFIDKIKDYKELNTIFYEKLNREGTELPYLNGSLFDKEEYMQYLEDYLAPIMDSIFKEARNTFNKYNFTVNETLEKEVSLDPLLLGTVLENMLPEQERGKKGTFYTPVEEISFMCRRAISNYLGLKDRVVISSNGNGNGNISYKFIDGIDTYLEEISKEKDKGKKEKLVRDLRDRLLNLKVLDPAVGSGGFLVVMLDTIIDIIHKAEAIIGWHTPPVDLKNRILPNLYGFDIEPEAVEIARLRLWLSLLVDQDYPEPLPNLDFNIEVVGDSLAKPTGVQIQMITDEDKYKDVVRLREEYNELLKRYINEHKFRKKELRDKMQAIRKKISESVKFEGDLLERFLPSSVDIVIMNPPYVRQEDIPKDKKEKHVRDYKLNKMSDIYCYFMVRALDLINDNGVVCTITSDKWLEASYGIELQKKLKRHLIAIYGQRYRSFNADVNTIITVYSKRTNNSSSNSSDNRNSNYSNNNELEFIYLESYTSDRVIDYSKHDINEIKEGKWFYLRAPKIFTEKILPKLTHKLSDFAEIKFGIKTGANDFFYMRDISHLYGTDISNTNKFKELVDRGIKSKDDLINNGLIYIENEGKERFVIDRKDVMPLIRTPKEIQSYIIPQPNTLCLYTNNPGKFTNEYIRWGERKKYNKRPTCTSRKSWYKLSDLKPTRILLPMFWMDTLYIPLASEPIVCDNTLYTLDPKDSVDTNNIWLYLNSILFLLTAELFGRRLGGGAIEIKVEDYEEMPVPDLSVKIGYDPASLLNRKPLIYYKEIEEKDRQELDKAVLRALGFNEEDIEGILKELYNAFVDVVEDRLIKADRPLKRLEEERVKR